MNGGRNIFAPDKSDATITQKLRGPEHDWIENHPDYIAAQEIDRPAIAQTAGDLKDSLHNEIRAEGFDIPNEEAALKEIDDIPKVSLMEMIYPIQGCKISVPRIQEYRLGPRGEYPLSEEQCCPIFPDENSLGHEESLPG